MTINSFASNAIFLSESLALFSFSCLQNWCTFKEVRQVLVAAILINTLGPRQRSVRHRPTNHSWNHHIYTNIPGREGYIYLDNVWWAQFDLNFIMWLYKSHREGLESIFDLSQSCDQSIEYNPVQDGCECAVDVSVLAKLWFARVTGMFCKTFSMLLVVFV